VIGKRLFSQEEIAARVAQLATHISRDYAGTVPVLAGVLNAAATFLCDLTRAMTIPCELDVIALSQSDCAGVQIYKGVTAPLEGRHVLVVKGSVETGTTAQIIVKALLARQPASVAVCTLLDRPARRIADIKIAYRGFEVPDVDIIGYGLGYRGRYRELPALHAREVSP
jgi:hypoxanthine phosphoribosyltransferase